MHSGWSTRHALLYNAASALTFPLGGLLAYGFAGRVDVAVLVPFAAGNFIYIALADLLPEITTSPRPAAEDRAHREFRGRACAALDHRIGGMTPPAHLRPLNRVTQRFARSDVWSVVPTPQRPAGTAQCAG